MPFLQSGLKEKPRNPAHFRRFLLMRLCIPDCVAEKEGFERRSCFEPLNLDVPVTCR